MTTQNSGDATQTVQQAWALLEPSIRAKACRLTADEDFREDLMQEALIGLWQLEPTRFDFREEADVRYVRRALKNRMMRLWVAEVARERERATSRSG